MVVRVDTHGPRVDVTTRQELARHIDDTRLVFAPGQDPESVIRELCESALREGMRAVCVRPEHVRLAKSLLKGSPVLVATVIGFPKAKMPLEDERRDTTFGDIPWEEKAAEMRQAKADGADEFDIVANVACLRETSEITDESPLQFEVAELAKHAEGTPIKLIIETDLLSDLEIAKATHAAMAGGIEYVKTSTGMLEGGRGATPHNISLIFKTIQNAHVNRKPGIKASGGVRTAEQAYELLQEGADIIGSSAGVMLLNDFDAKNGVEFNT